MKPIKIFLVLVPLIMLVTTVPANGFFRSLDIQVHQNYNNGGDDHPWGGDESPDDIENLNKTSDFSFINTPLFFIEMLRVIYMPDFNYQPILDDRQARDNGLLPDTYNDNNGTESGRRGN
nr:hypothetical protein [candidate division Zixibacteria bacterium]